MSTPFADPKSYRPSKRAAPASEVGGALEIKGLTALTERALSARAEYSRLQVWLHWLIAALVLVQLTINDAIRIAFRLKLRADSAELELGALLHICAGLAVFALTALRFGLRMRIGAPPPPQGGPRLFEWMGLLAHWGLYALLFLMTLSGAAAWFILSPTAATVHEVGRLALVALILAHMLGALVEHYLFGNEVIQRMRLR